MPNPGLKALRNFLDKHGHLVQRPAPIQKKASINSQCLMSLADKLRIRKQQEAADAKGSNHVSVENSKGDVG